jgi:translation initiation factor IF-3
LEVLSISAKEVMINDQIRAKEVRVIDSDGSQLGILPLAEALKLAYGKDLDLVEISPNSAPPVCRVMDYGKFRFERDKKEKEAKKKQQTIDIKEIQLSCRIDTHDFETKLKHARRFLDDGNKVKVCVKFKGREMSHTSIGHDIIVKFGEALSDIGVIEKMPVLDGRQMIMFVNSKKNTPQNATSKKKEKAQNPENAAEKKPATDTEAK